MDRFDLADQCNDLFSAKVLVKSSNDRKRPKSRLFGVERSMVSNVYDVKIERCGLVE